MVLKKMSSSCYLEKLDKQGLIQLRSDQDPDSVDYKRDSIPPQWPIGLRLCCGSLNSSQNNFSRVNSRRSMDSMNETTNSCPDNEVVNISQCDTDEEQD